MSILNGSRSRIDVSPAEFLKALKAGEHGCVFYRSREEMHDILFAFVKSGLEDNWGVVYAIASEEIEEERDAMQIYEIDTENYEANGSLLLLKGKDLYQDPKNPDLENWKGSTKRISESFIAKGKKGVRLAADLSSYFLSRGLRKQWFDLEYAIERKLSLPLSVLCAYDAYMPKLWDTDILKYYVRINGENKDFIDAHSFAIFVAKGKSVIFRI